MAGSQADVAVSERIKLVNNFAYMAETSPLRLLMFYLAVRTLAPDRSHLASQLASTSSTQFQHDIRDLDDFRRSLNERLAIISGGPQHAEAITLQRGQQFQKANGKFARCVMLVMLLMGL